jgi:hypothetical protein
MPRAKKKEVEENQEQGQKEAEPAEQKEAAKPKEPEVRVINVESPITRVLPLTIHGQLLVAKPIDPEVARLLSPYSPIPPKKGGSWTDREKAENKKRERQRWKLGKRGHYQISLDQLKMSNGLGYGIPSAAIMRAIQTANRNMPQHRIPEELLNMAIEIPSHDVEKSLLRVVAKKGPFMKEDAVRVGHKPENGMKGTPSWTVRPAWIDWKISLEVYFVKNLIDGEQVFNLVMWAGKAGILEGRPSKGSALNWGRFTVEAGKERLSKIG